MFRKLTLHLCAFLLLASCATSASACGLFPFLNPFAWTCGYGYGNGCGYGGYGYGACGYRGCGYGYRYPGYGACCGYGYGGYGYGYGAWGGGYNGWMASGPAAGYPAMASASDCDCGPTTATPTTSYLPGGTAWSTAGYTPQTTAWSGHGGWSPHRPWTPPSTAWQAPQTAMSTAPIYGPTWEMPGSAAGPAPRVAGDIHGDHEVPVMQNSWQPGMGAPIHPASYQPRPRTVRRYTGVVH